MRLWIHSPRGSLVLTTVVIVAVAFVYTVWLSSRVGFNMDELVVYQALGCAWHSCAELWSRGAEPCRQFDLAPLHWLTPQPVYLPLRSYPYLGSLQGLFYLPLYLLWKSPYSARLFGVLLLGAQSFLISKVFGPPVLLVGAILLLFMPYAFQHFMDTGELSLCTTSVFLLAFLHKRWLAALIAERRRSWVIATAIGLINLCILLFRLNNVAYMPAFILAQIAFLYAFGVKTAWNVRKRTFITQLSWMVTLFLLGAFVWFTSIDRSQVPLYRYLLEPLSGATSTPSSVLASPWRHFVDDLSGYIVHPLTAAHIAHRIEPTFQRQGIELIGIVCLALISGWFLSTRKEYRVLSVGCVVAFLVGVVSISAVSKSWAMHHIIPVFPLLLIALFSQVSSRGLNRFQLILLLCFAAINVRLYAQLLTLPHLDSRFDPGIVALNEELNNRFAGSHIMVIGSWGLYYPKLLYGPAEQCLIWVRPSHASELQAAQRLKAEIKKPLLFIVDGPQPPSYWSSLVSDVEQVPTTTQMDTWTVWREK